MHGRTIYETKKDSLKRAEMIYNYMKTQYAKNQNGSIKPGLYTMNAVCQAYMPRATSNNPTII
jgi:hypothetical protein